MFVPARHRRTRRYVARGRARARRRQTRRRRGAPRRAHGPAGGRHRSLSTHPRYLSTVRRPRSHGDRPRTSRSKVASGSAFVAHSPDGPTAIVLIGRGRFVFSPPDAAERTQVRLFSGRGCPALGIRLRASSDPAVGLRQRFATTALVPARSHPLIPGGQPKCSRGPDRTSTADRSHRSQPRALVARPGQRRLHRGVPDQAVRHAHLRARRRRRRRHLVLRPQAPQNISVYASEKLAARGRFFSEDDRLDFDVIAYDIEAAFCPERLWIDGTARWWFGWRAVRRR